MKDIKSKQNKKEGITMTHKEKPIKESESKDNDNDDMDQLNINEDFAKRFQYNKKRQLVEKAKAKYGNDFAEHDDQSSDSDEMFSEDSEGELDNEVIRDKFIDTYLKLKDTSLSKAIINDKTPIFNEDDFKDKRPKQFKATEEKVGYSITDALINITGDNNEEEGNDENDIYSVNYKPKKKEQSQEKKAFLDQVNKDLEEAGDDDKDANDDNESNNFFDDGLLKQKPKKKQSLMLIEGNKKDSIIEGSKDDNRINGNDQEEEVEEKVVGMSLDEALQKSKIKIKNVNMKLLQEIWGDKAKMSNEDRFLRNYILSEGWIERDRSITNKNLLMIDKIDEENDDKFDNFESKYNHRFEEEGGANITTYQRNIDTYRQKDDTRIKKRKEHDKRKEDEKERLKEEIQQAKQVQAEEMKEKLEKIEKIAGTEKIAQLANEFNDEDFDMKKFDKKMNEIFNEDYYNQQDKEMEMKEDAREEAAQEGNANNEAYEEDYDDDGYEDDLWFYCDNCKKVIKENKIVYECKTCPDYSLCKDCFKSNGHNHHMKKNKVPFGCKPPENYNEIITRVEQETGEQVLTCTTCNKEIITAYYFTCSEEECSKVKICKTCRGTGKSIHEHKLTKFYIEKEEDEEEGEKEPSNPKEKLQKLIDGKTDAVIDDIIAKEIPSKFHYAKVSKDTTSELTNEMLLLLDDKLLNQYIPLKKIAPYSDFNLPDFKKKQMKKHFEKLLDKRKKEMMNDYENQTTQEKKNEKLLLGNKRGMSNNKKAKNTGEFINNKDEYKKKKRLETYGITE